MNKGKLKRHRKNRTELQLVEKSLEKLYARLESVPDVSVKVQKSGDEFPYIEGHMTVKAAEPKSATAIKKLIHDKEIRRDVLKAELGEVEDFINGLPEGIDKQIFEMIYFDGGSYREVGMKVGYSAGRISQIIAKYAKD